MVVFFAQVMGLTVRKARVGDGCPQQNSLDLNIFGCVNFGCSNRRMQEMDI